MQLPVGIDETEWSFQENFRRFARRLKPPRASEILEPKFLGDVSIGL
jgi:hypothetical protein